MNSINELIALSRMHLCSVIKNGDRVVDATAGNGQDTLFLAGLVGPEGMVYSFDIQETALCKTAELLNAHQLIDRVCLHKANHGRLGEYVSGNIKAVLFNLGYLPGGNKALTTEAETTIRALASALEIICAGGAVAIVSYSGHNAGAVEEVAVAKFCQALPAAEYSVVKCVLYNKPKKPPILWLIIKTVR